eukprot:Gb_24567 [translate_table: standard]
MSNRPTSTRFKALVLFTSNSCPPTSSKIQQGLSIDGQAFLAFGSSFLPLSLGSPNSSLKASSSFAFAHLTSPFEVHLPPEAQTSKGSAKQSSRGRVPASRLQGSQLCLPCYVSREIAPLSVEDFVIGAYKDIREYYLKEFCEPEAYVENLRETVVEWHAQKHQLWDRSVDYVQRRMNEVGKDAYLTAWEPWRTEMYSNARNRVDALGNKIKAVGSKWIGTMYYPSPVLQPFLKDIGENSPIYKPGWISIPHNSEATRGELPGGRVLREVMYHNTLTQKERKNLSSTRK